MHIGTPELLISSLGILFVLSGRIIPLLSGRSVQQMLGIRTLTFERTSDIVAGLMIVTAFLATFLLLARG